MRVNNSFLTESICSKLKNIPEELFKDTKDLLEIDLSSNNIQNLPPKLFHKIKNVDVIKLKGNFLQSIEYSPFSRANKLTILDISDNKIQTIDRRAFSQLREIETLNLSNNQINYTDETEPDWSAMTNLKEFILNNNNISTNHIPFSQASPYEMLVIVLNSADFRQDKHNCFVEF